MFDWSSFLGGVAGSAVAGGASVGIYWLTRRDSRAERLRETVKALNEALLGIESAARVLTTQPRSVASGPFDDAAARFTVAYAEFSARLKPGERAVKEWLADAMPLIVRYAEGDRRYVGVVIVSRLAEWLSGRTKTRWFRKTTLEEEFDRVDARARQ